LWLHVLQDATQKSQKVFVHVPSEIGAYEAEEIGTFLVIMDLREVHLGI
jgi:26S proteasome regulatory subunit N8